MPLERLITDSLFCCLFQRGREGMVMDIKTLLGSIGLDTRIYPDIVFTEARGEYENQVRINLHIQTCGS